MALKTVCLCMIVKNEARIIERCLSAAKFAINYVSICDTGSTDKTVSLIESWLRNNNVPGKVHTSTWKNFGYNRSIALEKAHTTFPQASYLLLLDADMVLVDKGFTKEQLKCDGYMLTQTEQGSSYRNMRIVNNSFLWKSVGVTHEYTTPAEKDKQVKVENLDTLWIDDRSDGGSKDDKLDRDASLLIQGLKDEPDNSRYMFYLANTYFTMNQLLDAIYWYEQRLADKKNKFEEEAWYATYRIAQCYEKMKDYPQTVYWYMKAINRRPHRMEPYVCLAKHYIFSEDKPHDYYNASWVIRQGMANARRDEDLLFIEDKVYDYEGWYCIVLASHYIGRPLEGYAACQKVLASRAPDDLKNHVSKIRDTFYKPAVTS